MDYPLLSVSIITYNHEAYLRKCLENVIAQKTNFTFEVIVGEDCSTDGTRAILKEFELNYPHIIKPIYHEKNVGMVRNGFEYCFGACKGKYVACLEGDDYWTDPYKLQKQVDFLEANPEYSLCFHNTKVIFDNENLKPYLFNEPDQKEVLYFDDLSERWQVATASMVFRRDWLTIPDWFYTIYNCDMAMQFLLVDHGPFKYIDNVMSVYRRHDTGISHVSNTSQTKNINSILSLLKLINEHFGYKYQDAISKLELHLHKLSKRVKIKEKFPFLYTIRNHVKKMLVSIADKL